MCCGYMSAFRTVSLGEVDSLLRQPRLHLSHIGSTSEWKRQLKSRNIYGILSPDYNKYGEVDKFQMLSDPIPPWELETLSQNTQDKNISDSVLQLNRYTNLTKHFPGSASASSLHFP
jgi:hypothetical protein